MKRIFFVFIIGCSFGISYAMDSCNNNETGDNASSDLPKAPTSQKIDEAFTNNCKEIVLYRNVIESKLPEEASLQTLDLSNQRITSDTIEADISVLAEVMRLTAKRDANSEVVKLVRIKYINLQKNCLDEFPKQFLNFAPTTAGLDLSSNRILKSPELSSFSNLYALVLKNNKLKILTVCALPKLGRLIASHNQIEQLNLESLPELNEVDLSFNKLKSLQENFSDLTELEKLNLSFNEFEGVPHIISKMKKLMRIDMVQKEGLKVPIDREEFTNVGRLMVSSKDSIKKPVWGRFVEELYTDDISNYEKTGIPAKSYFLKAASK
ncbi:leucine-rich repeat domain-containing protein [Candidatus Dependentiae bacterium]|nr:leucine-rich repeat domain-containing protein [Candidatus Dependentiae bacterium]